MSKSIQFAGTQIGTGLGDRAPVLFVGIIIALLASIIDLSPIFSKLGAPLETRFERSHLDVGPRVTGIVVLGGAFQRLEEAGRLARKYPHLKVFVSGAGSDEFVHEHLGTGIGRKRLTIEHQAQTTFENAQLSKQYLKPDSKERWLLVTSAIHMPRAMGTFQQIGFNVEPWPVFDLDGGDTERRSRFAKHEWLGLAYYWMLSRTNALLPGPESTRIDTAARPARSPT